MIKISSAHKGLAKHEIEELFENVIWKAENLALVNCEKDYLDKILKFAGSIRLVFQPLVMITTRDISDILETVEKIDFSFIEGKKFMVRVYKIGAQELAWKSDNLERVYASKIFHRLADPKVDLKNPDVTISIVVWNSGIAISRFITEIKASTINKRAPKNLPNSKGGAMKQTIAKLMVNTYRIEEGEYVMDPFCGHGGLLYEMIEAGYNAIGIELDSRIVKQGCENMEFLGYRDRIHLIHGDALHPPLRRGAVRYVVTDPPYALQTTTSGRTVETIITDWLNTFENRVVISMATPNETLKELPKNWITLKYSTDYVHRGLTRTLRLITNG